MLFTFETSAFHPRYHSNCDIYRLFQGYYPYCTYAADSEGSTYGTPAFLLVTPLSSFGSEATNMPSFLCGLHRPPLLLEDS